MRSHILLTDIQTEIANFLKTKLHEQGYCVSQIENEKISPLNIQQLRPDLIVLNLTTTEKTDFTSCRQLSLIVPKIPIILLGRNDIQDRVTGLNTCALDYLSTPFSIEEFLARIRAKLRRVYWEKLAEEVFEFADLRLDAQTHEVYHGNQLIELTAKEFDLLKYLIARPQQVMTHQQILDEVWPDTSLTQHSNILHVYIRYLRRKLSAAGNMIQTVRGVGYTLKEDHSASYL